ncbi:MAG: hypothetical protein U0531_02940 [Dehalococcoidia bacterium]
MTVLRGDSCATRGGRGRRPDLRPGGRGPGGVVETLLAEMPPWSYDLQTRKGPPPGAATFLVSCAADQQRQ